MTRKSVIERPVIYGCVVALTSVVVGVFWGKTLEQQVANLVLGFAAGVAISLTLLWVDRLRSKWTERKGQ